MVPNTKLIPRPLLAISWFEIGQIRPWNSKRIIRFTKWNINSIQSQFRHWNMYLTWLNPRNEIQNKSYHINSMSSIPNTIILHHPLLEIGWFEIGQIQPWNKKKILDTLNEILIQTEVNFVIEIINLIKSTKCEMASIKWKSNSQVREILDLIYEILPRESDEYPLNYYGGSFNQ